MEEIMRGILTKISDSYEAMLDNLEYSQRIHRLLYSRVTRDDKENGRGSFVIVGEENCGVISLLSLFSPAEAKRKAEYIRQLEQQLFQRNTKPSVLQEKQELDEKIKENSRL